MDRARAALQAVIAPGIDARAVSDVGRTARLELAFAMRDGRTVLEHAYAEPPLRAGRSFEEGSGVHMILASSAPGIFGGDRVDQHVRVGAGACVRLTSQSALQLHPAASGVVAIVRSRFDVAAGATLMCDWDPLIPFAGAALEQTIEIRLASGSRLWWSDGVMSGRHGGGERWQFTRLAHELRLLRDGELDYLERYDVDPQRSPVDVRWVAGNATHVGTVLRSGWGDAASSAAGVHARLLTDPDTRGAADVPADDLLVVRIASNGGVGFRRAREAVRDAYVVADLQVRPASRT